MFSICSYPLRLIRHLDKVSQSAAKCRGFSKGGRMGRDGLNARRVTTTLTVARKSQLEGVSAREGVTEAWIVRRALEQYLDEIGEGSVLRAANGR